MSATKVTIALLTGLAGGAALGILFAPQAGIETRDKISGSLSGLSDTFKETATEQINSMVDTFKTKAIEMIRSKISGQFTNEPADDLEHA